MAGNKLIFAVLQGEDYDSTVYELNQAGFFVTLLSSTGGFLKKKSTTVMIGVEEEKVPEVKAIYPSFDVVPPHLISGVVTDKGVYVPYLLDHYFDSDVKKFY